MMRERLSLWLYGLLMRLGQPLLRRKLQRRGRSEPGYLQVIEERFGRYAGQPAPDDGQTVWIHAVSLGETRAVAVLVAALRAQLPGMRLLLTHGTATGRAEGVKLLQPGDLQAWQPWDTAAAARRFLAHFRPRIGILMETEIWPNLVQACRQQGVPLVLANARLSDKSLHQSQRLAWLARPAFAGLRAVWAQTPADADRLAQLGAPVQGVFGNLKFDAAPDAAQLAAGRQWRKRLARPVLMLASSREGEERALLGLLRDSMAARQGAAQTAQPAPVLPARQADLAGPAVQWLIVPRHPQRFDEVAALIQEHGFAVSRRSSWAADGPPVDAPADPHGTHSGGLPAASQGCIWLGDSLGEMALYYGLADAALLGGSFEPLGGQNLIEAAACGCPVVMGPHTFNFADAAEQAQAAGAARRAADLAQAQALAIQLANNPAELNTARQSSLNFAQAHRGAAGRLAGAVAHILAPSGGASKFAVNQEIPKKSG